MADTNSSSDSDNALLPDPSNSLRIASCNAATQTPELPRHAIAAGEARPPQDDAAPPSVVVLRVGDDKDLSDFEKEARALAIPDVVVEYIRDTCALKEDSQDKVEVDNPAFDGQEDRCPSRSSLREEACSANLQIPGGGNPPIGAQNPRLYYSMPRKTDKRRLQDDFQPHSQPSTPKLQRLKVVNSVGLSPSLVSLLQQQGAQLDVPPSPNFGYRPLESETSAVYTIIKTCVNSNALQEIHFVPTVGDSEKTTPGVKRKFEHRAAPPGVERMRRRLQFCTDTCSLLFLLPGILLAILTPIFIVPMFLYPLSYFLEFIGFFLCSGTISACILTLSGLVGNTVWHYNEQTGKLRPRLHCGRGPIFHFWGNGFFSSDKKDNQKELIV